MIRGLDQLGRMHSRHPELSLNSTLEAQFLPAASAWRLDLQRAANFTAVRNPDGSVFFLHPAVGSSYDDKTPLLEGGGRDTCIARGTCFESMSAPLPDGGSNQHTNYANFRIFSETLLSGVLDNVFEEGIQNFRENNRGTLLGMTRFRDVVDDMPILGYGKAAVAHDRVDSFHTFLTGHTLNYNSRGTGWGTEQRQQLDWVREKK